MGRDRGREGGERDLLFFYDLFLILLKLIIIILLKYFSQIRSHALHMIHSVRNLTNLDGMTIMANILKVYGLLGQKKIK